MDGEIPAESSAGEVSRPPKRHDLSRLAAELNRLHARYRHHLLATENDALSK